MLLKCEEEERDGRPGGRMGQIVNGLGWDKAAVVMLDWSINTDMDMEHENGNGNSLEMDYVQARRANVCEWALAASITDCAPMMAEQCQSGSSPNHE